MSRESPGQNSGESALTFNPLVQGSSPWGRTTSGFLAAPSCTPVSQPITVAAVTTNDDLLESWLRSKRAANLSPTSIRDYGFDGRLFLRHLDSTGTHLSHVTRGDVEQFMADRLAAGRAAATVARNYRSLVQLFRYLDEEDELAGKNPMTMVKAPIVPESPPPVITEADYELLLAACEEHRQRTARPYTRPDRPTFENKRDVALIRMLWTTGVRAAEIMGLTVANINLKADTFTVRAKGRIDRVVPLTAKTSLAVDRYLRARARHVHATTTDALWLGDKGQLTDSGLRQMIERRCIDAGIAHINPHKFRHTLAHRAKTKGMSDGDLMSIAGWTTPQMLHRYGKSAAAERARASHHNLFKDE